MSRLNTGRVKTHDNVELAAGTDDYSDWISVIHAVEIGLWVDFDIDTGGDVVDVDISVDFSPFDAYVLNNKTCTTEDYVNIAVATGVSATVLTAYDKTDVAHFGFAPASVRVLLHGGDSCHDHIHGNSYLTWKE